MLDAHNCYPYDGQYADRIDRALTSSSPASIEQDLAWGIDKKTGKGQVILSHTTKDLKGTEPTLRGATTFSSMCARWWKRRCARTNPPPGRWWFFISTLKTTGRSWHRAVWELLGEYEGWLTTAPKMADPHTLAPFDVKPVLVLTEDNDAQEAVFFTSLPVGASFASLVRRTRRSCPRARTREERAHLAATAAPELMLTEKPTNYRRWWNNSWAEVEEGGQARAGDWTAADMARLKALVDHAHKLGFWIRFYTLDGFTAEENHGWDQGYNFGTHDAAVIRWKAAYAAGVNLIRPTNSKTCPRLST